jgi:hypothetical protein
MCRPIPWRWSEESRSMLGDDVMTFNGKIMYYNILHFAGAVLCNYYLMHGHERRITDVSLLTRLTWCCVPTARLHFNKQAHYLCVDNRHHTVPRVLRVGSRSQWPGKHVARVRGTNVCQINRSWKQYDNYCIDMAHLAFHTRPVRKVFSHFEYLENRSRGLDVTWQPVRGDLTVHPWIVTLVGLVNRQWDAVEWACVLCDRRSHKSPPFQQRF